MSFWNSSSKHYQGRHVLKEARYDALAGIFGRSKRTIAIMTGGGLLGILGAAHAVELDTKPATPAEAPAYAPAMQPEIGRHIRVGQGVLERCNDEPIAVRARSQNSELLHLTRNSSGGIVGNTLSPEKLAQKVAPALVRLEQNAGIDVASGEMRVNRWNGVIVKGPDGPRVVSVGHGLLNGESPVHVTDASGYSSTVTGGCYIYQTNNHDVPIQKYPAPQNPAGRPFTPHQTADVDLGIFTVDGLDTDAALTLASRAPERGSFNMFVNHPHGGEQVDAFSGVVTSAETPILTYLTGIDQRRAGDDTPQLGSSGGPIVNKQSEVTGISFGVSKPLTPKELAACGVQSTLPQSESDNQVLAVAIDSGTITSALEAASQSSQNTILAIN
ncbi:MAG TPA: trypsin-like peptidase domain-containing protein [Candidatus Saccharimonadales bacterium]|nr:trypsin-like peptidase domain-containing protein [Candidatus Saccharimonadales bacterium]